MARGPSQGRLYGRSRVELVSSELLELPYNHSGILQGGYYASVRMGELHRDYRCPVWTAEPPPWLLELRFVSLGGLSQEPPKLLRLMDQDGRRRCSAAAAT